MTSDTYVLHQTVGMIQRIGIRAPLLLFGGIIVSLTMDPMLTLIMVASLPIVGVIVFYVSRKGAKLLRSWQKASIPCCAWCVKTPWACASSRRFPNRTMSVRGLRR